MADVLSGNVRSLQETLRSRSSHRGLQAAQLSSDLYQLCVESVSDTELGAWLETCIYIQHSYSIKSRINHSIGCVLIVQFLYSILFICAV